jgi:selenophosphate synthase
MYYGPKVEFESGIDDIAQRLLFDAQTSGGLLIALPVSKWEDFSLRASVAGLPAWPIGVVEEGSRITVKANVLEDVFIQGSNGYNVRFIQ